VREHRRAHDIADREDMRHIGAHLLVHGDDAACVDVDPRGGRVDCIAVGAAAHRDEHPVELLRLRGVRTLECGE
jgi:hypothetical protein